MKRTKDSGASKLFRDAVTEVSQRLADRGGIYHSKEVASNAVGMESLADSNYVEHTSVKNQLMGDLRSSASFMSLLGDKTEEHLIELALESAAYTIMATHSEVAAFDIRKVNTPDPLGAGMDGFVVMPNDGSTAATLESFEGVASPKYSVATALANAQAAVLGGFEDAFFPTQLVPAGANGVDLFLTIPKITSMTPRSNVEGGTIYTYSIVKTSLIKALIDPSLLESNATTIYPYTGNSTGSFPGWAVPVAQVPQINQSVQGQVVQTSPILFGTQVDVIQASADTQLLTNQGQILDETDALDPNMNIGILYIQVTATVGGTPHIAIYAQDVSTQPGALLTQVQQGRSQAYQTTGVFDVIIGNTTNPVGGTAAPSTNAQMSAAFESLLGLGGSAPFNIDLKVTLSATGDTEYGNFRVDVPSNGITIGNVYDANGGLVPGATSSTFINGLQFQATGCYPLLRRTNSNLRNNGTIIDSNTTRLYRYAVQLSAPIIAQTPIGSAATTTLESLTQASRIRQNGRCVTALLNAEAILQANNGIPVNTPMPGAEFVNPTYLHQAIDVTQYVSSLNSMDNLQNLRGAIRAAMSVMVNQALVLSQYPAALEMSGENPSNFEVILVTDQEAFPHFMVDGDSRFLGDGRFYRSTVSNNKAFSTINPANNTRVSKVYFTFRRKARTDELNPLDFGKLLLSPSITYEVQINRNQRTTNEVHTVPRLNAYVFLPVLLRLDLLNLESIYSASSSVA